MSNENTEEIFNLKEEILKVASKKNHAWTQESNNNYGEANGTTWGHVKVQSEIPVENDTKNNDCATIGAIKGYVINKITNQINTLTESITGLSNNKLDKTTFNTEKETKDNEINTINTSITSIQNNINNLHTFNNTKNTETDIDALTTPGYYSYATKPVLKYGLNDIKCGIVTVKKINDNSIVQYIESTDPVSGNLDGNIYTRLLNGSNWSELEVVKRNNIEEKEYTVDETDTKVVVKENTAGYTITWIQTSENKTYTVTADLYEYAHLCNFEEQLLIDEYIFGNLIGKMDVRITSTGMQVRSTLAPNNVIKNVHETYFIPRLR